MPAAKKYVVLRYFRLTDPRTGVDASFAPGAPYVGAVDNPYLLDSEGPDGKGPLIGEVVDEPAPSKAPSSSPSDSAGDSGKEKN